ncbi:hypothetical protein Y032_0106g3745 [Ancylostoma ceylanicum]|uniref:Uncharacterized protein n=1 Tax=Ancylostoma ceylanicum TaxID=53326 RepID=A0A016TG42_9BILA|nr:hypothetical protein Y032_0106g3745 [Ancylostoma ceylanicum]
MFPEHRDCSQQIISIRRVKMADQRFQAPMDNVCSIAEWLGSQTTDTKSRYQVQRRLVETTNDVAAFPGLQFSKSSGTELPASRKMYGHSWNALEYRLSRKDMWIGIEKKVRQWNLQVRSNGTGSSGPYLSGYGKSWMLCGAWHLVDFLYFSCSYLSSRILWNQLSLLLSFAKFLHDISVYHYVGR